MPLDDHTRAELMRSAREYIARPTASTDVPARIQALRGNMERIAGRAGKPAETYEQNAFELEKLEKFAAAADIPIEIDDQSKAASEDVAEPREEEAE